GGGGDGNVHPTQRVDLVVLDLGENDLLPNTHVVVATAIERLARNTPEVTDAGHCHRHQTIEELVHLRAAQGHHATNRIILTDLEARDRFPRLGDNRLLACDLLHGTH